LFDAACRLVEFNILLESRAPHTLLALAEAGQGGAIIPSLLRTDRYALKIVRVTHRRKPLRERFCHSVGQAVPFAALCRGLLRGACPVYARGPPDYAAVQKQDDHRTEAGCCSKILQVVNAERLQETVLHVPLYPAWGGTPIALWIAVVDLVDRSVSDRQRPMDRRNRKRPKVSH